MGTLRGQECVTHPTLPSILTSGDKFSPPEVSYIHRTSMHEHNYILTHAHSCIIMRLNSNGEAQVLGNRNQSIDQVYASQPLCSPLYVYVPSIWVSMHTGLHKFG